MKLLEIISLTITCNFAEKDIPKWEKIICTIIFSFLNIVSIISLGIYAIFIKEVGYTKRIIGEYLLFLSAQTLYMLLEKPLGKNNYKYYLLKIYILHKKRS